MSNPPLHYVYRVTHRRTGEFYIGCRTALGTADGDHKYVGSGRWPRTISRQMLRKEILGTFATKALALKEEYRAIHASLGDALCRNRCGGVEPYAERASSRTIGIRLPSDLFWQVRDRAAANSQSMSYTIFEMVQRCLGDGA
jgi:hypothetical protein